MDFIISYQLYNNLKKKELSDELKELKEEERSPVRESCSRCGQNPYLCQCQCDCQQGCEKYSPTKYYRFNPEKDNY
uniref:Uncharacterized protein n=1 Tax=viral metagenome TaxID=1070528 RepID=A0A6C0FBD3_9ZZZZ